MVHKNVVGKSGNLVPLPHAETYFMISIANCQAFVSSKALYHHDPNKIIEVLKQYIDMSVFVGSRPQSSVHIHFERFDTSGISFNTLEEAKKAGLLTALVNAARLEVQWNRDSLQYLSGPLNLHLVIHGTPDRQKIENLTPLAVFSRCLTHLEFTSRAGVLSLMGIEQFAELRSLNITSIDHEAFIKSMSSFDISKLPKFSHLAFQNGVWCKVFLALAAKLPALTSFKMLLSSDPNIMYSHFTKISSITGKFRNLKCLHIKPSHMDTFALTTFADIFTHYLPSVEVLGIYFEYFVVVNDIVQPINLTKQDLGRILKRFESCTGVKKLVFVMVGADHMDRCKEKFLSAPSAFDEVAKMKVALCFNVFE
ncbi:hypothetical protein HDU76_002890 [Blyttiomyces sp. JEL0837]|nr:hypothetical protein HDU76_002890 [Blyttiomyces sp. JEL0837]